MCRRWSPTAVSADAKQRGARQHIMGRRRHDDPPPQGLRAARCRTARCRVKLYGASTTRRPTAARRCVAGRRRSSVTVSADAGLRGAGLRGAGQHCMGRRWHDNPPPPGDVRRTGDVRRSSITVCDRTARCQVTLYGASLARRPTAERRCAACRRRSSVTVSPLGVPWPSVVTDGGRWDGPMGRRRRAGDGRRPQRLLTPDSVASGNTAGGVVGATTHRRKEECGGQAMVAGRSVC